ncbi:MAG: DUF6151 family protein [Betaproteobacteria bacterium]|nr:DUF6151 family protein [Betaproteobacteria bacterium]
MADLEIGCGCGKLRGVIRDTGPRHGSRVICYCRDCQAAAHHLGHPETLDEWGGTDLFVTTPARMQISAGADQLACFRFSPSAPRRWYAACCNTPIGNGFPNAAVPFLSLNLACASPASRPRVGPATRGMQVRDAHGSPTVARRIAGRSRVVVLESAWRILVATLRGQRGVSPFMRAGQPVAEAKLLSREARAAALASAGF